MLKPIFAVLGAVLLALPAAAEGEFSAGSQVEGWTNLQGREPARFTARVTDIVCALTGDCPADCGNGARLMGLIREADEALVLVSKNREAAFNGGGEDLVPYCGQTVEVDGLLVGDPAVAPTKVYQVFLIRPEGAEEWVKANRWTRIWREKHPEAASKDGPWFRNDPAIAARIAEDGYLGLGPEADATFIEENF